jgi:multiple sugar transport system ATP-binding protein
MNFLPGTVGESGISTPFGDLPMTDRLRSAVAGRDIVIVGIRPDAFHDVDDVDAPDGAVRFDAEIDVTEWLGSELYAYVPFTSHDDVAAKLEELDRDLDGEGMRTQLVVSLDAMSTLTDGDDATLWFDPASAHVFDPETGDNLTRDPERAEKLDEHGAKARKRAIERAREKAEQGESDVAVPTAS